MRRSLTTAQEKFLIERLKREWAEAEQATKKHELVQKVKSAAGTTVRTLLGLALAGGLITIAAAAPGFFMAFEMRDKRRHYISEKNMNAQLQRGSARSYWKYEKVGENEYRVHLTPYGKKVALKHELEHFKLRGQPKWDGKWRVVMFDIARRKNSERDSLRRKLTEIGMYPLQQSVFVYPYPCADEVMFWASLLSITDFVHILEANFLTENEALMTEFSLKN